MTNLKALYLTKLIALAILIIYLFHRVTAFAPQDHAKELVTLRKPTVYKVTMMTAGKKNKRLVDLASIFQSVPKVQAPTALARQVDKSELANL